MADHFDFFEDFKLYSINDIPKIEKSNIFLRKIFLENPRGWLRWFFPLMPKLPKNSIIEFFFSCLKFEYNDIEICPKTWHCDQLEQIFDVWSKSQCLKLWFEKACILSTYTMLLEQQKVREKSNIRCRILVLEIKRDRVWLEIFTQKKWPEWTCVNQWKLWCYH